MPYSAHNKTAQMLCFERLMRQINFAVKALMDFLFILFCRNGNYNLCFCELETMPPKYTRQIFPCEWKGYRDEPLF